MICAQCGQECPEGFRFCGRCGAALESAVASEERKIVTVLFADMVGFTSRSDRMDVEDVRGTLVPYHALLRRELEHHGGTVEKFIGDAVVAVFGAPTAHEDDPERAVRAALAIRAAIARRNVTEPGLDLHVRIGVDTGEALVVLGAGVERGEGIASGDVVNTAARLQAAAPVDGILVGERTYRASDGAIRYRAHESVAAKGKPQPVAVWEAVEARTRWGADAVQRPAAPLVGRGQELGLLRDALSRCRSGRLVQLVTVVGVPGIGKSRLVRELFEQAASGPDQLTWRQGRSPPYGEGVSYWALGEMVKAQAQILESDTPEQAEQKLGRAVEQVADDASDTRWLERYLRPLVGLTEQAGAAAQEGYAAWRHFLEAVASQGPLVLVFEDLHWADDGMLDFVNHLVERVSGVPLLVLATARPELLQRRAGWGGGKPNALTISLPPLSSDQTLSLVDALLDQPQLGAHTRDALLARAGGNPLYAEQYARVLLERGDVIELPEAVLGIIAARLDTLSEEEKRLLQAAAVVGEEFWLGAVEAVHGVGRRQAEELLYTLERKEFVQRLRRPSSAASQTEYAFSHMLIRDVAYGQIPRAARSLKHQRAAAWIESLARPEDQAEVLSYHYLQALELAEAAGIDAAELGESARRALRDAGDRAAALYAADAAQRFYDAALRLWPTDDPERPELLFRRAAPVPVWGGGDAGRLAEARDALLEAGHTARAAEAECLLSEISDLQGRRELADEHAERALALSAGLPPDRSSSWLTLRAACQAVDRGDYERGIALGLQARRVAEQLGSGEALSDALTFLGTARVQHGDRQGLTDLGRSVEIATDAGALGALCAAHNDLAAAYQTLGDLDSAYAARADGARVAERAGSASQIRWFQGALTDALYRRGEWDEARRQADDFLHAVDHGSPHVLTWQVAAVRAAIRMAEDDPGAAVIDAERALAAGRATRHRDVECYSLAACAHVLALASQRDRASALAGEYLEALRGGVEMGFAVINLPTFASAARQLDLSGELSDALTDHPQTPWTAAARAYAAGEFAAAADILQQTGSRPEQAEARLQAAAQLVSAGRPAEAGEHLHAALAFHRSVAATRYVRDCEALLPLPQRLAARSDRPR
jgi:class 3 adenylate cyclase